MNVRWKRVLELWAEQVKSLNRECGQDGRHNVFLLSIQKDDLYHAPVSQI